MHKRKKKIVHKVVKRIFSALLGISTLLLGSMGIPALYQQLDGKNVAYQRLYRGHRKQKKLYTFGPFGADVTNSVLCDEDMQEPNYSRGRHITHAASYKRLQMFFLNFLMTMDFI